MVPNSTQYAIASSLRAAYEKGVRSQTFPLLLFCVGLFTEYTENYIDTHRGFWGEQMQAILQKQGHERPQFQGLVQFLAFLLTDYGSSKKTSAKNWSSFTENLRKTYTLPAWVKGWLESLPCRNLTVKRQYLEELADDVFDRKKEFDELRGLEFGLEKLLRERKTLAKSDTDKKWLELSLGIKKQKRLIEEKKQQMEEAFPKKESPLRSRSTRRPLVLVPRPPSPVDDRPALARRKHLNSRSLSQERKLLPESPLGDRPPLARRKHLDSRSRSRKRLPESPRPQVNLMSQALNQVASSPSRSRSPKSLSSSFFERFGVDSEERRSRTPRRSPKGRQAKKGRGKTIPDHLIPR
jgi:L-rhamnose mutarotase